MDSQTNIIISFFLLLAIDVLLILWISVLNRRLNYMKEKCKSSMETQKQGKLTIDLIPMSFPNPFQFPIANNRTPSKTKCAFGPCKNSPVFSIVDKQEKVVEYVCEQHTGMVKVLSLGFGELELKVME